MQLGGVQLDKDLRCLMGYLSTVCEWPVRDKFALLLQLATILSLDNVSVCYYLTEIEPLHIIIL